MLYDNDSAQAFGTETTAVATSYAEIEKLLPALDLSQGGRVVALTSGHPLEMAALLPFHLHLWQPDAIHWLGINAEFSVVPFSAADRTLCSSPLYRVGESRRRRQEARTLRLAEQRVLPEDLDIADWEAGAARHDHLDQLTLPPNCFLCIERVRTDGTTARGTRGQLGRHARRSASLMPRVLVPSRQSTSSVAARVLASSDVLLVNLQRQRGPRTLDIVREVLEERPVETSVLIVAASASELLAAGLDKLEMPLKLVELGEPSPLQRVDLSLVGEDRLAADQRFEAAIEGLSNQSASAAQVVAQAEHCWWTLRQILDPSEADLELQRFQITLDRLRDKDAFTADLFTGCREVLHALAFNEANCVTRLRTVIEEVLNATTTDPILVVTRTRKSAKVLQAELAAELGVSIADLTALGVSLSTVHSRPPRQAPGLVVLVGYAGLPSIDAALASGTPHVRAILDPVEIRAAWYGALRLIECLTNLSADDAVVPVQRFAAGLSAHVTGFGPIRELDIGYRPTPKLERSVGCSPVIRPAPGEVAIVMTDGAVIYSSVAARFEVLGTSGFRSRVVVASELEPGDQVVLVDEDSRLLFSEQRMLTLDMGVLKEDNATRQAWIDMVRAVAAKNQLTAGEIASEMEARGYSVSVPTVRSWLEEPGKAHAPIRFSGFLALAKTLGLVLTEETLRYYYDSIRRWRVRHRLAGRRLTQAIRLAQSGRLGAVTQARIEREWGLEIRGLIEASRVLEVDDVIRDEESFDSDE